MSAAPENGSSAARQTLACLHTVLSLPPVFAALAEELLPGPSALTWWTRACSTSRGNGRATAAGGGA